MSEHKQKEASEKILNQEISLTFKRKYWIVIFNILVSQPYKLRDAKIVNEIVDNIQPVVAVDSNINPEPEEGIITN